MCNPVSSQLGTPVAKRWCKGFLEVYRVQCKQNSPCQSVQCNATAMTWTFYTTFTKLLLAYTDLYCTWCGYLIQKPLKVYSWGIRTSQEASGRFRKRQSRQGDQSRLGGQALWGEQTRPGDQVGQGDQPLFWGQALQKEEVEPGPKKLCGGRGRKLIIL